jgi:hypothetical protein
MQNVFSRLAKAKKGPAPEKTAGQKAAGYFRPRGRSPAQISFSSTCTPRTHPIFPNSTKKAFSLLYQISRRSRAARLSIALAGERRRAGAHSPGRLHSARASAWPFTTASMPPALAILMPISSSTAKLHGAPHACSCTSALCGCVCMGFLRAYSGLARLFSTRAARGYSLHPLSLFFLVSPIAVNERIFPSSDTPALPYILRRLSTATNPFFLYHLHSLDPRHAYIQLIAFYPLSLVCHTSPSAPRETLPPMRPATATATASTPSASPPPPSY